MLAPDVSPGIGAAIKHPKPRRGDRFSFLHHVRSRPNVFPKDPAWIRCSLELPPPTDHLWSFIGVVSRP